VSKPWHEHKICIGLCNNQDKINSSFFWNFLGLFKPRQHIVFRGQASIKSASLNTIVKEAWKWKCEKIIFMDIDMEFPFDTIPKLLSRNLPIVSGLYYLKAPPYSPVAGWKKGKRYINNNDINWKKGYAPFPKGDNHLVEVDWAGIGCLMIDMDVFNKMRFPCFYDKWSWERGERQKGHDMIFCQNAQKAGYRIYVDTLVQCDHVGAFNVNDLYVQAYHESQFNKVINKVTKSRAREAQYWEERHFADKVQRLKRIYPNEWDYICSQIPESSSVAEVGCGPGYLMEMLRDKRKCSCYGFDLSSIAIEEAKSKGFDGEVADFRHYNPNGKLFDHVVASHVLEHMVDDVDFLKRMASLLKNNNGKVIVAVPTANIGSISELEHQRVYNAESLKKTMEKVFAHVIVETEYQAADGVGFPMLVAIGNNNGI